MIFSQNWFKDLGGEQNFSCLKNIFTSDEPINFLEIGSYEGNCHLWMYQNLLTNKLSKSTAIDPFGGGTGNSGHKDVYDIFVHNLHDYLDRITILRNISNNAVPLLNDNDYDIIYIDGDHTAKQTYLDATMCWNKLKTGGIMIFDDYLWHDAKILGTPNIPQLMHIGEQQHPALGINIFLKEKEGKYVLLGKEFGFNPECKLLDLHRLNTDIDYAKTMRQNYNYQIFIKKI